jgi:hypothetical protein
VIAVIDRSGRAISGGLLKAEGWAKKKNPQLPSSAASALQTAGCEARETVDVLILTLLSALRG